MKKYVPKIIGFLINVISLFAPKYAAKQVLALFSKPRGGQTKDFMDKFYNQFEQRMLKYDGMDIATYRKEGTGKRILLAHGWESNAFRWRKLVPYLVEEGYEIIMLDAPGHGSSGSPIFNAPTYAAFINEVVKIYPPDIVLGHSIGGFSVLYYLRHYEWSGIEQIMILASPDTLEDITSNYFELMGYRYGLRKHYDKIIEKRFGNKIEYYSAAEFISEIDLPGTLIHSEDDDINLYREGQAIAANWKRGELVTVDGFGHGLQDKYIFNLVIGHLAKHGT